jgi:hypothetical protein
MLCEYLSGELGSEEVRAQFSAFGGFFFCLEGEIGFLK